MSHAPDTFGIRLMKAQSRANMRVNALARAVGVNSSHISTLRLDKRSLSVELLARLCVVLDVSADFLLGLSDEPQVR